MRTLVTVAALLTLGALGACERKTGVAGKDETPAPPPYRPASAAEVFELRSRCADLGQKILDDDVHGPALSVSVSSHYNPRTNRCYVELWANKISDPLHTHHESLFDGQTRELLAFTEEDATGKKKAAVFAQNDKAPPTDAKTDWYTRSAEYIADQMADDRTN